MNSILELFNFKKMKKKLKKENFTNFNDIMSNIWDVIGLLSFVFVVTILVLENLKNFNVITVTSNDIYKYIVMIVSFFYITYNFF